MSVDYKLIAFDLDGTLAESKMPLTSEMAGLLNKLSTVAKVAVISGGSFERFEEQLLPYLIPSSNIILLPTDGGACFEYNSAEKQWRMTESLIFNQELKKETRKVLDEIIGSGLYDIPSNPAGEYVEDRGTEIAFSALGQEALLENKKDWDPDQKKRQKIKQELEKRLPDVSISIAGTTSIDILPKGFNKAVGLEALLKRLDLTKKDVVFLGDAIFPGGNDYSVFEAGIESIKVSGPLETERIIRKWLFLKNLPKNPIAFFCSEYAPNDDSSQYAGGLGILAGDFVLEMADQNVPFVGIGLKYSVTIPEYFSLLPDISIEIPIAEEMVIAQVWHRELSPNTHVFLLDAGTITAHLYDPNFFIRLKQQIVLGVGGIRLISKLGISPSIYHLNEGHTAFAGIAILHENDKDAGKIVASKHTILSDAGILIHQNDFKKYLGTYYPDIDGLFEKGRLDPASDLFSTTKFIMSISARKNAVSVLHAEFEKKKHPQSALIPITNGVRQERWQSPELFSYYKNPSKILTDQELWNIKRKLRSTLLNHVREVTGTVFNPDICTLVWARRFASYKRPELLFIDKARLLSILTDQNTPLQIVISGKAHEADVHGKAIVEKIIAFSKSIGLKNKVVYMPNYSLPLALKLVQGADIWLNTPELGMEACGTSGMKSALNGALQCSIPDGWVGEVSWSGRGWSLPGDATTEKTAEVLYDLLEHEILPCFYSDNLPQEWVNRMRSTMELVEKSYTTKRMLADYMSKLYQLDI